MNSDLPESSKERTYFMLKMMNECVDCGLPCMGAFCPLINSPAVCCDRCEERAELFYLLEGEVLCRDCFIDAALENAVTRTAEQILND